jgi:hypothetical protein
LNQNVQIDFHVGAAGRAFGDAERQRPLGPTLAIEPAVHADGGNFEISIPEQRIPSGFSRDDLAFAMEEVAGGAAHIGEQITTQTHWQFYRVSIEDGRFVARVDGLPGNRVQFGVAR